MTRPLDPFSEVVDTNRRWTPEWYTWLQGLSTGGGTFTDPVTFQGTATFQGTVTFQGTATFLVSPTAPTPTLSDSSTKVATTAFVHGLIGVLSNYLGGLTLSNDSTTSATFLDVATGAACSDDNTTLMALSSSIRKDCNSVWAAGNNSGALDGPVGSHLVASTWYHVFLIGRVDTNTADIFISTNVTSPILPLPYTKKRRIGSIRTDASAHIIKFVQIGDQFLWAASTNGTVSGTWDLSSVAVAATPGTLFTLFTPLGISTKALLWVATTTAMDFLLVSPLTNTTVIASWNLGNASVANVQGYQYEIWTNTTSQILVIAATAQPNGFFVSTAGWTDPRGK